MVEFKNDKGESVRKDAKFDKQYTSEAAKDETATDVNPPTLEEFFYKNTDVAYSCGKLLCDLLNDVMLSIFAKKDILSEKLEAEYQRASERIKLDLTELFESEAQKIICTYHDDGIRRIVIIDQNCPIDKLEKTVLYYPDCAPLLSDWKIPEHEYITYRAPEYQSDDISDDIPDDIKDVLFHPSRLNSQHFPIEDLQIEEFSSSPISKVKIPYSQSMFYDFQIQYMTSKDRFLGNSTESMFQTPKSKNSKSKDRKSVV